MTEAHPDDELLSAHLDGEVGPDLAAHVAGCEPCRARLADLAAVVAAVAARPEAAPGFLDAAVAAALDHAGQPGVGAAAEGAADGAVRPAAPITPLGAGRRPPAAQRAWPGRRRLPPLAWVASAAAAVVLLAGLSQLLPGGSGDTETATPDKRVESVSGTDDAGQAGDAAAPEAYPSRESASPTSTAAALAAPGPVPQASAGRTAEGVVYGGDLGDQRDPEQLASVVDGTEAAPLQAPAAAGVEGGAADAPGTGIDPADPPCVDEARDLRAGMGPLLYVATVRWRGTPGVVLVFRVTEPAGGVDRQLYVMSRPGCALLAEKPL